MSLILVPTRELAMQVDESVRTYGRTVPLRSTVVYGGIPMDPQIKALRGGVEILVATPGRLLDLVGQKVANLGQVEILVLDEADRMLDMGFLPDIQRIIELLPPERQNLMFSATFSDDIRRLSRHDPARPGDGRGRAHATRRRRRSGSSSTRSIATARRALLAHLIRKDDLRQVLVFTRTKLAASRLATRLDREGSTRWPSTATAPSRSGHARSRGSRPATIRVLVATDVAARGLDIEDLPVVVNFELPWNPQDYIHRIGRTGRAGATGEAISLVCIDEADLLRGDPADAQAGDPVDGRGRVRPGSQRRAAAARDATGHARVERRAPRPPQAGPPARGAGAARGR